MPLISYRNINVYQEESLILENVNLSVGEGEFVYVTGKVGAGKSSFIKTLYAELPVNGNKKQRKALEGVECEAEVLGFDLLKLRQKDVPVLRRHLGVIFQDFQLLSDRTVYENLRFVLRATGWKKKEDIAARIKDVLTLVDMVEKADKMPNELSGGEKQRVAIARAILNNPKLIIADEPTGNLDADTSRNIVELLLNVSRAGSAVIMITHNLSLLEEYPARVLHCKDKAITEVTEVDASEVSEDEEWKELIN